MFAHLLDATAAARRAGYASTAGFYLSAKRHHCQPVKHAYVSRSTNRRPRAFWRPQDVDALIVAVMQAKADSAWRVSRAIHAQSKRDNARVQKRADPLCHCGAKAVVLHPKTRAPFCKAHRSEASR